MILKGKVLTQTKKIRKHLKKETRKNVVAGKEGFQVLVAKFTANIEKHVYLHLLQRIVQRIGPNSKKEPIWLEKDRS